MPVPKTTGDLVTAANWNAIGMFQIASLDLSSTATFSAIPQLYRDLHIEVVARATGAVSVANLNLQVNGASTAAYYWHRWRLINATEAFTALTGQTSAQVGNITGASADTDFYGNTNIVIPEYSSTGVRIAGRSESSVMPSSSVVTDYYRLLTSFGFNSGVAVTSVTLLSGASGFAAGSRATLYGVGAK